MAVNNFYGRERFVPAEAKQYIESIIGNFKDHYSSLGYQEESSVLISSGVDPTVRFIGSPISVLKHYLIENRVPTPGVFLHQDCIRTKNLKYFLDDDFVPVWGSYFPNMGAITPPKRFYDGCNETFDFFEKRLGILPANILIRINSADKDFIRACQRRYGARNLEIDGKDPAYYRHTIGTEDIIGRNCNIALRGPNGKCFSDVANLISIENSQSQLCLEMSIGTTTILKEIYGLDHVLDCTPVVGLESVDRKFRRKFEDAIITSMVLFHEGLRPKGQNNRTRIFKKYIQAISYFRARCHVSVDELFRIIHAFEEMQFPGTNESESAIMTGYICAFEKELIDGKDLTEEQGKIKQALLRLG